MIIYYAMLYSLLPFSLYNKVFSCLFTRLTPMTKNSFKLYIKIKLILINIIPLETERIGDYWYYNMRYLNFISQFIKKL